MSDVINLFKHQCPTPVQLVDELTENLEEIEQVLVVVRFKNGESKIGHSHMPTERVCWFRTVLDHYLMRRLDEMNLGG